ncbi:hypothetical protein IE81DRAFT_44449 [Ceraceosorus guamensis]|uniref:Auxin efflux carrier n=1 Tax=Ceraceosorus guamensis TaxID=1522189 RepID=A0A316W2U1_9BASI|nr:hypothetical protein IE81DRAFT_44449 [Ceraceosorus guamensis]PWN44032.1 hypothetical protein IE81DRAFT_44449 [Ceraceosorus guamensis]
MASPAQCLSQAARSAQSSMVMTMLARSTDLVLQRQFAMAGTRLAAVLNTVLLPEAQAAKASTVLAPSSFTQLPLSAFQIDQVPFVDVASRHDGDGSGGSGGALWPLIKVTASSIIEVALLSVVGYFLARRGVIDKTTQTKLNKINVSFFTPALLFSKVAFTLNPGRLAELAIVPIGFVVVSAFSAIVAYVLARIARITRAQRNFAIACAMSPNSNSLPVALMQSLVMTVPQLHWEEEGEPEDTVDGMLGRALTYLVLFSTLGMLTRWSIGAKLLATVDEEPSKDATAGPSGAQYADYPEPTSSARTGTLIDVDDSAVEPRRPPSIKIRRATGDVRADAEGDEDLGGPALTERRPSRSRPVHWTRSFPNTPTAPSSERGSDDESDGEEASQHSDATRRPAWARTASSRSAHKRKSFAHRYVLKPYRAFMGFMTMPLWAAVISLIVAMIRPLQVAIGSIEPLVGALQTAGSVSVPLTMVVLGAYFVPPEPGKKAEAPAAQTSSRSAPDAAQSGEGLSQASTLVGHPNPESDPAGDGTQADQKKGASSTRKLPWMRNPWGSQSQLLEEGQDVEAGVRRDSVGWSSAASEASTASVSEAIRPSSEAASNARSNAAGPAGSALRQQSGGASRVGAREAAERREASQERRTIAVSLLARMVITPLVVIPIFAYYCIATRENVADDPVLIVCALLLIGSPPALTLAQITQSSKNGGFERLISKTIFVAYVILSAPTTVILTVIALRIAENDHGSGRTGGS